MLNKFNETLTEMGRNMGISKEPVAHATTLFMLIVLAVVVGYCFWASGENGLGICVLLIAVMLSDYWVRQHLFALWSVDIVRRNVYAVSLLFLVAVALVEAPNIVGCVAAVIGATFAMFVWRTEIRPMVIGEPTKTPES